MIISRCLAVFALHQYMSLTNFLVELKCVFFLVIHMVTKVLSFLNWLHTNFFISRQVVFNETVFPFLDQSHDNTISDSSLLQHWLNFDTHNYSTVSLEHSDNL